MGNTRINAQNDIHLKLAVSSECSTSPANDGAADSLAVFTFLSREVQERMGKDFLAKMPLDVMERYCMATARQNDPTAALLYELVTNFMKAYSDPETSAEALKAFDFLTHISGGQG